MHNLAYLAYIPLAATALLSLFLLSPLVLDVINLFRPAGSALLAIEEIPEAYSCWISKLAVCSGCQSFWAVVIVSIAMNATLVAAICAYTPTLLLWLLTQGMYRQFSWQQN